MPYIHFTEEQKCQANQVDLVEFLRFKGDPLICSGPEFRMAINHSVTVRDNGWYDHAAEKGGGPVSFLKEFYGMNYAQAVLTLLDEDIDLAVPQMDKPREKVKKSLPCRPPTIPTGGCSLISSSSGTWTGTCSPPSFGWGWSTRIKNTTTPSSWAWTRTARPATPTSAVPTARANPSA